MTGRVDFLCIGISSGLPFVKEGKLTALAVNSAERSPSLPDVRTTLEAGYANSDYNFWLGMLVPARTPRAIIGRLHDESEKALKVPAVQAKLNQQGVEPFPMTPTEMDALIRKEIETNLALVKAAGIKFN